MQCIGLMIQNGGDLNILSAEGYTPPGMAKEATLKLLNLEDAVKNNFINEIYHIFT